MQQACHLFFLELWDRELQSTRAFTMPVCCLIGQFSGCLDSILEAFYWCCGVYS